MHTVRCGFDGIPTVWFGAALKNRRSYGAVRCGFQNRKTYGAVRFGSVFRCREPYGAIRCCFMSYGPVRCGFFISSNLRYGTVRLIGPNSTEPLAKTAP